MLKVIFTALAIGLSGCAGLADGMSKFAGLGVVSQEVSAFDNATVVTMTPSFLLSDSGWGSMTKLGARWSSNDPDNVGIQLLYNASTGAGGAAFINLQGLDINVDGAITRHKPIGLTGHDSTPYNTASKTIYTSSSNVVVIPLALLERMVAAEDCRLRIYTSKGYEDSFFSPERIPGGQGTAKLSMKDFLAKVLAVKNPAL